MRYILNSAVVTKPGTYTYRLITADEAKKWIEESNPIPISCIAYQETCDALEKLTGFSFPRNRIQTYMQTGDEALIFRLTARLSDPDLKGKLTTEFILKNCEIGILTKEK